MKYLIELPDVIKDEDGNEYEPTGEFRKPKKGEHFFSVYSTVCVAIYDFSSESHIILRRKWMWPTWLKGWGIAMDANGRIYVFAEKPIREIVTWQPINGGFVQWVPEVLGPPPPITDWTKPILNPNYKSE